MTYNSRYKTLAIGDHIELRDRTSKLKARGIVTAKSNDACQRLTYRMDDDFDSPVSGLERTVDKTTGLSIRLIKK